MDKKEQVPIKRKTSATLLLLAGSALSYVFIIKIIARIWDPQAFLQHGLVGVTAGLLIWAGTRQWSRWRFPLGMIWTVFCAMAFFNSTYYEKPHDWPQVQGFRTGPEVMRAMSRASVVMSCVALATGVGLILWQRHLDRPGKLQAAPSDSA